MKLVFLLLLMIGYSTVFSQASVCGQFHRTECLMEVKKGDKNPWKYNAQSKSGLFNQGSTSKIRCVIYKGMDYRINVCAETALGDKLHYKIFDARNSELLYDNSSSQFDPVFEFQSTCTRPLIIELTVPTGATEKSDKNKPMEAACVGLLIEHKVTERQGFSSY